MTELLLLGKGYNAVSKGLVAEKVKSPIPNKDWKKEGRVVVGMGGRYSVDQEKLPRLFYKGMPWDEVKMILDAYLGTQIGPKVKISKK